MDVSSHEVLLTALTHALQMDEIIVAHMIQVLLQIHLRVLEGEADHQMVVVMVIKYINMEVLFFILFIGIIGIFIILSRPSFEQRKSRLLNMYSSVLSDMNMDYKDTKIGAENIRNIAKSILNFSWEIKIVSTQIAKESEENKKWLFEIISEFSDNLSLWIHRHMDELKITKEQIANTTPREHPTLELIEKRLDMQVENLQKIIL